MGHSKRNKLVITLKDKCRVCYTCVRECPVKAIKINNGQAEVINERCIGCGNCVKVCSQGAKLFLDLKQEVINLLQSDNKIIACVAPSFPAEFDEINDYKILVGMIKKLGFYKVVEVAFGADIIAKKYKKYINNNDNKAYISSDCPSIVYYIEHYHPALVENLVPVVSPMVAIKRIVKAKYGEDIKVVFIGPCIAKKAESDEIDEVITFKELRDLFEQYNITTDNVTLSNFDSPKAGRGAVFPISRGLLQTAGIKDDLLEGDILSANGERSFKEVIKEFEKKSIDCKYMELLCCKGCISGPGMTKPNDRYFKRNKLSDYVKQKYKEFDAKEWKKELETYIDLDFSQTFNALDRRVNIPEKEEIENILSTMGKKNKVNLLNCGACGYDTCEEHAIAIIQGLAETEMCLPYTIEKLHKSIEQLNISNENLANARQALKHSEKLASMGQLSAGIAHELNNPLGIITMYSNILKDETDEINPIYKDLELIVEQTNRCKKIVGGLLNFARKNNVKKVKTDIKKFIDNSIEQLLIPNNIEIIISGSIPETYVLIDQDQMMQVLTNLEKNAIEAMPDGGKLYVELSDNNSNFIVKVKDTGIGIPDENMDKLYTPFFTTKEVGKGTGLGLPLVYGIVKMHNGKIDVKSNNNKEKGDIGTIFTIEIPKS